MPDDVFSYLFSPKSGGPAPTYDQLQTRRKLALQLMANSRKGYPKTIGEGLTAIGDAIGERGVMSQLDAAEQAKALQDQEILKGTGILGAAPAAAGPQSESVAPVKTAYASESETPAAAPTSTVAGYRPAPAYLRTALEQDVADPERRAYLGQLAGKEAQSADEVSPTGAAGPFQFTRGTGAQYGLMPGGQDMRSDIHGSIAAVQNLTDDNAATLTKMLGRTPSPGELALAHQQGAVTAGRMLTGAGNAPANNLAVNNVNPGASPQAAAAKIMGYYGMPGGVPNPRDAIAATLAQRQAGPQPNPTQAGPSAALPFSGSPTVPGDLPPEITSGASAIRAAPPAPSQIQAAPVQVAQAAPALRQPVVPQPTPQMLAIDRALSVIGDPIQRDALTRKYQELQKNQISTYNQQMEEYKYQRDQADTAPQRAAKLAQEQAQADVARRTGGLGNEPLIAPLIKSADAVKGIPAATIALRTARDQLAQGMFTGTLADQKLATAKTKEMFGRMFGLDMSDPKIATTEAFKSAIMPLVAQARSATSGNANISDADINLALSAVGGNINLDEKTFPKVFAALERINLGMAMGHQGRILGAAAGNENAARALQGVYGLPMEQIIPPQYIQRLRDHPDSAAEFDKKFATPGLANRILSGG